MLLAALLVLPAQPLVVVSTDGAGWRLSSRPAREMVQRGFWVKSAAYDDVVFELGSQASVSALCATQVDTAMGPLVFSRQYNWNPPGAAQVEARERMRGCSAQRRSLVATSGTLEKALAQGQPEAVQRALQHASMPGRGLLGITLDEVGQPLREQIERRMQLDARTGGGLSLLDTALALRDGGSAGRWLAMQREPNLTGQQRHALFQLGLAARVDQAGGYSAEDFEWANEWCDGDYARFLMDKGIAATADAVVGAFLARAREETPWIMGKLDLRGPYGGLLQTTRHVSSAQAPLKACLALVQIYRSVPLDGFAVTAVGQISGAQMLGWYRQYARDQQQGRRFATRAQEDAFYDALVFDQQTAPMPTLPSMFAALLQDRPGGAAACAALGVLPRLMGHDGASAALAQLAASWKGHALIAPQDLRECRPGLVFPPSYIAPQTRAQNAFLAQAGIDCTVTTPQGKYVYNQDLHCGRNVR